jgi:hypothetical protein
MRTAFSEVCERLGKFGDLNGNFIELVPFFHEKPKTRIGEVERARNRLVLYIILLLVLRQILTSFFR